MLIDKKKLCNPSMCHAILNIIVPSFIGCCFYNKMMYLGSEILSLNSSLIISLAVRSGEINFSPFSSNLPVRCAQ